MMTMRVHKGIVASLIAGLLAVGCSGGSTSGGASTSTPSPSPTVVATRDVRYAADPDQSWYPRLLDIYEPAGAKGLPMVVFFPGGLGTDTNAYAVEATAIAQQGAVVVVAVWGDAKTPRPPAATFITWMNQHLDSAACAVSFAVAHAGEYGADASRLVLVGHSSGASPAAMVALAPRSPFPACAAAPTAWTAQGVLMWEGDWMNQGPTFDRFGKSIAAVMPVVMPWTIPANGARVRVEFATSDTSRVQYRRCGTGASDWLSARDPSGKMRARLTAMGTFTDGCIDLGETGELLADAMSTNGFTVTQVRFTDPATTHDNLAAADLALLAHRVIALTAR
jgi:hypothetical protein